MGLAGRRWLLFEDGLDISQQVVNNCIVYFLFLLGSVTLSLLGITIFKIVFIIVIFVSLINCSYLNP